MLQKLSLMLKDQNFKSEKNINSIGNERLIKDQNDLFEDEISSKKVCECVESIQKKENEETNKIIHEADYLNWENEEIRLLFTQYDLVGPKWKFISQKLTRRTPNTIKNRFYTVLRNLVKVLFRKAKNKCPSIRGEIPSKQLSRLYDARQSTNNPMTDYQHFPKFLSKILHEIDYDIENEYIARVFSKYETQVLQIYQIIYREQGHQQKIFQHNLAGQNKTKQKSKPKHSSVEQDYNLEKENKNKQNYYVYLMPVNNFLLQLPYFSNF